MKIKDKDRLIARMILGIGLSLTVANAVACGITHPKFSDVKDEYWNAKDAKDAYLDTFEQSDEFKTTYNADVKALNDRLIAREISGDTYDEEIEKLTDNTYTEQVLLANANKQTKSEFDKINQKYLDTHAEWDKQAMPAAISACGAFTMPLLTAGLYYIWKPRKKHNELENDFNLHISEEAFKRAMELKDMPPYRPINAEDIDISSVTNELKDQTDTKIPNVPRHVDACIIKTEEENENGLNQ